MDYLVTQNQRTAWMKLTGSNKLPELREDMLRIGRETYDRRVAQAMPDAQAVLAIFELAVELGVMQPVPEESLKQARNGHLMRSDRKGTTAAND